MKIQPINSTTSFKNWQTERKIDKMNYLELNTYKTRELGMLGIIGALMAEQIGKKKIAWSCIALTIGSCISECWQKHKLSKQYEEEHPIYVG